MPALPESRQAEYRPPGLYSKGQAGMPVLPDFHSVAMSRRGTICQGQALTAPARSLRFPRQIRNPRNNRNIRNIRNNFVAPGISARENQAGGRL